MKRSHRVRRDLVRAGSGGKREERMIRCSDARDMLGTVIPVCSSTYGAHSGSPRMDNRFHAKHSAAVAPWKGGSEIRPAPHRSPAVPIHAEYGIESTRSPFLKSTLANTPRPRVATSDAPTAPESSSPPPPRCTQPPPSATQRLSSYKFLPFTHPRADSSWNGSAFAPHSRLVSSIKLENPGTRSAYTSPLTPHSRLCSSCRAPQPTVKSQSFEPVPLSSHVHRLP